MASLFLVELFSGSGSVGRAVQEHYADDFEIKRHSVDIHPKYNPTTATDLLTWDYQPALKEFLAERTAQDLVVVWMSPPCTMYSVARTTAKTPRDLEGSDALVLKALEIMRWTKPNFWYLENPVGMLRGRPIMASLEPFLHICSYCRYGKAFRKNTCIWTNAKVDLHRCSVKTPCDHYRATHKHPATAQGCNPESVYPIPAPLVHQLFDAAVAEWEDEALLRWGRSARASYAS
jgi:site-specific DNA-cytosine methylase